MFLSLIRLIRHRWMDEADARRVLPPDMAERLRRRVHASEQRHTGEVRICIEGGLPSSYLWRHLRDRVPMGEIVRQRALMQFSKLHVWDTEHNNGVLIYVLLAEHAIELIADRGVHRLVSADEWSAIVARLSSEFKLGHFEDGLTRALEEVSAVLVTHFPSDPSGEPGAPVSPNQLPDEPVLR